MKDWTKTFLKVTMPDDSKWIVPVSAIAENRAAYYKDEYGGSVAISLQKDTYPLFEESPYEIQDWAANNMDWSDVREVAARILTSAPPTDYEEGWVNGEKEVIELP